MDILSVIISCASLIGYVITIWSFIHQKNKELEKKSENDAIMRSDIKYLREKIDEISTDIKDLRKDNNSHDSKLSQHEVRIKALEDWRHDMEKQSSYRRGD